MSKLILQVPGGGTRDIRLDRDRITIGRRADNDVHLPYPAVSAEHAAIITVREDSFLEDLQSTNGTLVNGKRIAKHFLRDYDVIDVGRVQLVYLTNEDATIEPIEMSVDARQVPMEITAAPARADEAHAAQSAANDATSLEDRVTPPVDDLLAHLMSSSDEAAVLIDLPPVSIEPLRPQRRQGPSHDDATTGVYLEVMSGPNAGQIAPMKKREFVLGKAGATRAVIRRDGDVFSLVPTHGDETSHVNGEHVPAMGVRLAFGDTIEVAGVRLRFGRRPPL